MENFSDKELADALRFLEVHEEFMEEGEIHEWLRIKKMILTQAEAQRADS